MRSFNIASQGYKSLCPCSAGDCTLTYNIWLQEKCKFTNLNTLKFVCSWNFTGSKVKTLLPRNKNLCFYCKFLFLPFIQTVKRSIKPKSRNVGHLYTNMII